MAYELKGVIASGKGGPVGISTVVVPDRVAGRNR
jgi:hypothetical protein